MTITDLEMNELLVSIASKRERDIALAVFSIEGLLREIISLIATHPQKLQEIGGPIRAIERVSAADSDSENQDRNVFNVEVCVNPDSSHRTIDSQSMETEQVADHGETTSSGQIVHQLDSEQSVGEILIDQSNVEPTQISQSDVGEEVQDHLITSAIKDTELGTEVTTITTTDGENVQVVIKSVERRGHHEAAPSTITANAASSADLTPNVQTVTTSDGTCTNVYACPQCDKVFMRAFELQRHITVRHTNEKKFVCDVCGQKFALKLYLNNHVRNKHQPDTEKPFACPHCNYRCAMKSMLTRHIEKHTNYQKYQCDVCGHKFHSTQLLEQHSYTHKEKTLCCTYCDFRTANPSRLKYHMKTHEPPTEFQCSVCDYKCNIKAELYRHMTKMHGTKDFRCDQCELSFKSLSNLNRHQYVHAEKNLQCNQCEWRTADPYEFKRHEREHIRGKQHVCDVCGFAFLRAFDLKKHSLTHSKVLNCKFCPAVFSNAHELLCHKRRRHPKQKLSDHINEMVVIPGDMGDDNSSLQEINTNQTDMDASVNEIESDTQNIHEQDDNNDTVITVSEDTGDKRVITIPEGGDHERVIAVPEGQATVIVNQDGNEIILNHGVSIDSDTGFITVNVPSDSSDQTLLEMASAIIAQVDETTNT